MSILSITYLRMEWSWCLPVAMALLGSIAGMSAALTYPHRGFEIAQQFHHLHWLCSGECSHYNFTFKIIWLWAVTIAIVSGMWRSLLQFFRQLAPTIYYIHWSFFLQSFTFRPIFCQNVHTLSLNISWKRDLIFHSSFSFLYIDCWESILISLLLFFGTLCISDDIWLSLLFPLPQLFVVYRIAIANFI